jgi:hypothetical protein
MSQWKEERAVKHLIFPLMPLRGDRFMPDAEGCGQGCRHDVRTYPAYSHIYLPSSERIQIRV